MTAPKLRTLLPLLLALGWGVLGGARADPDGVGVTTAVRGGCVVRARAYPDPDNPRSARYDLEVVPRPGDAYPWDITEEHTSGHFKGMIGLSSPTPGRGARTVIVTATLWQYDTLEERVTFHDLPLHAPPPDPHDGRAVPARFLALDAPLSATTPSGIRVTLPAQHAADLGEFLLSIGSYAFGGNADALFIRVLTTPAARNVVLPRSPLYRKHRRPARIFLECAPPSLNVTYGADNTSRDIAVYPPNLHTITRLDALTLIVRQRVNLRAVPLSLRVPISRPARTPVPTPQ